MLGKYVDVFLPDFKYISPRLAKKLSAAENYPEAAKKALDEMVRLQPKCVFENGMIKKGRNCSPSLPAGAHCGEQKGACLSS